MNITPQSTHFIYIYIELLNVLELNMRESSIDYEDPQHGVLSHDDRIEAITIFVPDQLFQMLFSSHS